MDDYYTAYRVEDNIGEFAGKIRNEYESILIDIRNKCFINQDFIGEQSNRISKRILDEFGDRPSFEWESSPNFGVFKNKDTKKWYALIMNISKDKIDTGDEMIDVLNIKLNPTKIVNLLEKQGFYKAYHMNKKYWITISLDDKLSDDEIFSLIEESYEYSIGTSKTEEWIIPANPKYYDIEKAFKNNKIITWKQSTNIKVGDIVYMYVASPIKALRYKCRVLKNNIPFNYSESNLTIKNVMEIELLETYNKELFTFEVLNKYGVTAIRGPRFMPKKLKDYIENNTR